MPRLAGVLVGAVLALLVVAVPASAATSDLLLTLDHPRGLDAFVRSVSDPASPTYRRYWSVERLAERFGAPASKRAAAVRALRARDLDVTVGPTGTFLLVRGSRAALRRAFPAPAGALAAGARRQIAVPAPLRGIVTRITPPPRATTPPRASAAQAETPKPVFPAGYGTAHTRTGTPAGCPEGQQAGQAPEGYKGFTPNQYTEAYGHAELHRRGLTGQGVRVALVEIGGFVPADVAAFAACFGRRLPPIRVTQVQTLGLPNLGRAETILDLSMLIAGSPGLRGIDVYQGQVDEGGVLRLISAAIGTPHRRPDVVSSSLGFCEPEWAGARSWMNATNDVLAVAAGAGISVLDAAGDNGSTDCGYPLDAVDFPASSPYITVVGGTNITLDAANHLTGEVPWNNAPGTDSGGGGGRSLLFARPWWQRRALPPSRANDVTRALPDVVALADNFPGYAIRCSLAVCERSYGGASGWIAVGGTSGAAPLTAAGIALADQAARQAGQPPLGFLNPLLYRLGGSARAGDVFRDVTSGSIDVSAAVASVFGTGSVNCCTATPGFDLASGWGSLKVAAFSDAALGFGRRTAGR